MSEAIRTYHRDREQQCRDMAEHATDPDVRRRHEELASLHATLADEYDGITDASAGLGAI